MEVVASSPVSSLRGDPRRSGQQGNHTRYVPFPDPAPQTLQRIDLLWSGPMAGGIGGGSQLPPSGAARQSLRPNGRSGNGYDCESRQEYTGGQLLCCVIKQPFLEDSRKGLGIGSVWPLAHCRALAQRDQFERRGRQGQASQLHGTHAGRRYAGSSSRA